MDPNVDQYFSKADAWRKEMQELRRILLASPLTETLKWGQPCYVYGKANVCIIGSFKDHCVLSFFKGVLLKDAKGLLVQPGANTQSARIIPVTSVTQIRKLEPILESYILEAIEVEKAGLKADFPEKNALNLPDEFQAKLKASKALRQAFDGLTPGRQRAYNLYFSAPKQSTTREARIQKLIPRILAGKGLMDR